MGRSQRSSGIEHPRGVEFIPSTPLSFCALRTVTSLGLNSDSSQHPVEFYAWRHQQGSVVDLPLCRTAVGIDFPGGVPGRKVAWILVKSVDRPPRPPEGTHSSVGPQYLPSGFRWPIRGSRPIRLSRQTGTCLGYVRPIHIQSTPAVGGHVSDARNGQPSSFSRGISGTERPRNVRYESLIAHGQLILLGQMDRSDQWSQINGPKTPNRSPILRRSYGWPTCGNSPFSG